MRLIGPYTDVRIERPRTLGLFDNLPGLVAIDLQPPASGPEIELTFGTAEGSEAADERFICLRVEKLTGREVLASRRRDQREDES